MDMTTILTPPWPRSLSEFVVACLSWDPRKRPTSVQCLNHEYFKEVERYLPLREMMPGKSSLNIYLTTAPPALYPNSQPTVQRKPSLKGLGIDIPQGPRGARQQPSYTSIPTQTYPQELTHHPSQPQLQQVPIPMTKVNK
jgi:serine/threonine protein kinase